MWLSYKDGMKPVIADKQPCLSAITGFMPSLYGNHQAEKAVVADKHHAIKYL